VKTHLRTRAFVLCFLPVAALLAGSFWISQRLVESTVRDALQSQLRERQRVIATAHTQAALHNNRFLRIAGENTALKAGIVLLRAYPDNQGARRTVEDQLRELGERMGFDFMLVSGSEGSPMVGMLRQSARDSNRAQLVPLDVAAIKPGAADLLLLDGRLVQVGSVPVDEAEENIGSLTVGEFFNIADLATPAVLIRDKKIIASNIPGMDFAEMEFALTGCTSQSECDVRIAGHKWISLPLENFGDGYTLLSLGNIDAATDPIQSQLNRVFAVLALGCILIAVFCSYASSTSLARPIAAVVAKLRGAANTGSLPELDARPSSIVEIKELTEIYNRAALSVRDSGYRLEAAYLEFVGSLANALDARDPYTAGHSRRVSQMSCALADALMLPSEVVERIRIGALLHDIGKIGIADSVLQKAGRLTPEEFALVKQHPVIGRRILEGVQGFSPFLAAVELHHENWNGSGYPRGQMGEETPIDARIIHVADAYDAMTTYRSYRSGMTHETAVAELRRNAGIHFDSRLVSAFADLPREIVANHPASPLLDDAYDPEVAAK
jgi:HD-GYP domain-containing protein (c-di-GMP phosphodiesterase class II)